MTGASSYRIEVFLQETGKACNQGVPTGDPLSGVLNGFKVRSNCEIEIDSTQAFSFMGEDVDANVFSIIAGGTNSTTKSTLYDHSGGFSYTINTDQATEVANGHVTIENLDADDCDSPDGCTADGRSRGIHFLTFNPTAPLSLSRLGSSWKFSGPATITSPPATPSPLTDDSTGASAQTTSLRFENPSGNFDALVGSGSSSSGKFQTDLLDSESQIAVIWRNIRTENAVTILKHHGSPVLFPVLSDNSVWIPPAAGLSATAWSSNTTALAALLPFAVGNPGGRKSASTVAQAQALLGGNDLTARLSAATLNLKVAAGVGVDLQNAVIRGTSVLVSDAVEQANQVLANQISQPAELNARLDALNKGLVLFNTANPDLDPAADDDGDGIINIQDNCPPLPNPDQEDTIIRDGIGDACDPTPIVECVTAHGGGNFTAFFGYDNPFKDRRLRGEFNRFTTGAADRGQPLLQLAGRHENVFTADFTAATPLTWQLAGKTATAQASSPACAGSQSTQVDVDDHVVLLGSERVQLGDRTLFDDLDAVAAGTSGISIGFDAVVGNLNTEGSVTTQARVNIKGDLLANGSILLGPQNIVAGLRVTPAGVHVDSIAQSIASPPSRALLTNVANDQTRTLAPGNYQGPAATLGVFQVGDRSTLILQAGSYDFTGLRIGNDSHVVIDDSAGLVRIVVRGTLSFGDRTTTASSTAGDPQLLLIDLGSSNARLPSTFAGSVIAPNAQLSLLRTALVGQTVTTMSGVFFARRIIADNDLHFVFTPLH
jgi:hypothetical protein